MFKLLSIIDALMTRNVQVENLETGTVDICFDDSALKSDTNFEFMEIGKTYECKIELFGDVSDEKNDKSTEILIVNSEVKIGNRMMIEVKLNKDIYYIPKKKAPQSSIGNVLSFYFTRKDLIQVDNVIHNDLLS